MNQIQKTSKEIEIAVKPKNVGGLLISPDIQACYDAADRIALLQEQLDFLALQPVQVSQFPERDTSKPEEEQGMFHKFNVQRVDGSDKEGGRHHGCAYWVIDLDHDKHATAALRAYAIDCKKTHPELSKDLIARFGESVQASAEPIAYLYHDGEDKYSIPKAILGSITFSQERCFGLKNEVELFANSINFEVLKKRFAELEKCLSLAISQNTHDMLLTGDEIRRCEKVLKGGAA